ncbi:MAG: DUF2860 family protein, partial [Proteobacteria bacterium]|nr:DUF2860 family protein [Pseudomonadota bacterium]
AELFRTADWSGGLLGSYSGTAQFDLTEFDTHYPVVTAWLDREFGASTRARARYDVGYAWVDYDGYLFNQEATALLWHDWGRVGETELAAGYYWLDFKFDQIDCLVGFFPDDCLDRDGDGLTAGVEHRIPVHDIHAVRAGFLFDRFWADGSEYDYSAYTFSLGFAAMLPLELLLDVEGSYTYQPYDHPSFFTPFLAGFPFEAGDRRDDVWRVHAYLGRAIGQYVTVSAQYRYTNNQSNVAVYDYDRHVIGGYVTVYVR